MSMEWDSLYKLGTDVAAFMFFHPARLEHRKDSEMGWWEDEYHEEFQRGRMVAFMTGMDRTFTMKFVRRPLTTMEEKVLVISHPFRYQVQDGKVYWDNSDCLPNNDIYDDAEKDDEGWLEISNGKYRVTVHAMDWFSISDEEREAETDISHYIVRFEEVDSFDDIVVPEKIPELIASKRWYENGQA